MLRFPRGLLEMPTWDTKNSTRNLSLISQRIPQDGRPRIGRIPQSFTRLLFTNSVAFALILSSSSWSFVISDTVFVLLSPLRTLPPPITAHFPPINPCHAPSRPRRLRVYIVFLSDRLGGHKGGEEILSYIQASRQPRPACALPLFPDTTHEHHGGLDRRGTRDGQGR